jgi:hypothetical protein
VYDDQGQPLATSGLERFHLCDPLMRPFTTPFETASGQVRFTPPDKPFRIGMPLSVPGFGQFSSMQTTAEWDTRRTPSVVRLQLF